MYTPFKLSSTNRGGGSKVAIGALHIVIDPQNIKHAAEHPS